MAARAQAEDGFLLQIGTVELPPYAWVDPEHGSRGITWKLNEEIGQRSGLPYRQQVMPAPRLLESMLHGETHFVLALEKAGQMAGAEQLALAYQLNFILVTKRGAGIESLHDLIGRNILFPRMIRGMPGGMQAYLPELADLQVNPVDVNQYDQTLKMLKRRKHIHAAVISEMAYYYELQQLGLTADDFGRVLPLGEPAGLWAFVQPTLPQDIKDRLRTVVQDAWEERLFYRFAEHYLQPPPGNTSEAPR